MKKTLEAQLAEARAERDEARAALHAALVVLEGDYWEFIMLHKDASIGQIIRTVLGIPNQHIIANHAVDQKAITAATAEVIAAHKEQLWKILNTKDPSGSPSKSEDTSKSSLK